MTRNTAPAFHLREFERALWDASTPAEVQALVEETLSPLGFRYFDLMSLDFTKSGTARSACRFYLCNYTQGNPWDTLPRDYPSGDDVVKFLAERTRPVEYVEFARSLPPSAHNLLHRGLLKAYGIKKAWLIPLSTCNHIQSFTAYMPRKSASVNAFEETQSVVHGIAAATMDRMIDLYRAPERSTALLKSLTIEEQACLAGVASGQTNKEIGRTIGVSENTVRYHLKKVFKKLGVEDRVNAAAFVIKGGLFNPK